MMPESPRSPSFSNPPIHETVLGIQFAPIAGLTSGLLGWYWKSLPGMEWTRTHDAVYVPDQYETFPDRSHGFIPDITSIFQSGSTRLQILSASEDRVIQAQKSRFLYNWRKASAVPYPGFAAIHGEFARLYEGFQQFVGEAGLGTLQPNQWEVNYVNRIHMGDFWRNAKEWTRILPGLFPTAIINDVDLVFEGPSGEFCFEIRPGRGRLRIAVRLDRNSVGEEPEFLLLSLTARGPLAPDQDPRDGFTVGHRAIVDAFVKICSPEALSWWGKQ